jgi:hypothetical protein
VRRIARDDDGDAIGRAGGKSCAVRDGGKSFSFGDGKWVGPAGGRSIGLGGCTGIGRVSGLGRG